MPLLTNYKLHDLLAKLIFIALPTLWVSYYLLQFWNADFEIPTYSIALQTSYLAIGLISSMCFYAFGFRFIPTYILLILGLYVLYKGLDATAIGEFDTFFITIQFIVFALLFALGWFIGWGILRIKKFPLVLSISLLLAYIFQLGQEQSWLLVSNKEVLSIQLWQRLGPIILYVITTIYYSEFIHHFSGLPKQLWINLLKRSAFLLLLLGCIYLITASAKVLFFEEQLQKFANNQQQGEGNSLLKKQPNNPQDPNAGSGYQSNDKLSMSGSNQKENVLLFAAYIDNFFDDGATPNPLYLVSYYYTKYDTLTEAFERDTNTPDQDYFSPSVASIPMYHSYTDSNVLAYGRKDDFKKTISFDIYNKNLDPNFFVGPTTSYFVQPIAVEPMFRKEFVNAYRGKSSISEWNSAYFVYNVEAPNIKTFQNIRNEELKKHNSYADVSDSFITYYTYVPNTALFKRIDSLAKTLTKDAPTVIEKVLAIKSYFQKRDQQGKKIFRYSDNPGEPNLPGASRLENFLFKTKNGYCAYYAAATLYMLRSLGIPSRVVGGFLTEDRSADKNRGWYWYYADQAHAWVQVYVPGIGWIDFDTTIDNDEARESPQTDGTPPLQPNKATFASFGVFEDIDTIKKIGAFIMTTAVVMDQNLKIDPIKIMVDLSLTTVQKDTASLSLSDIKYTDSVTIVSYAPVFQKLKQVQAKELAKALPSPLPIDEVHILPQAPKSPNAVEEATSNNNTIKFILWIGIIVALTILILLIPYLVFIILKQRLNKAEHKNVATASYKVSRWLLQFFVPIQTNNDLELFQVADQTYGTNFGRVLATYHDYKYGEVIPQDPLASKTIVTTNIQKVLLSLTRKQRLFHWLQLNKLFI